MIAPLFWSEASNLPWAGILANHLWQSTVIAVMVWLLALTLRKNCAHTRYRLWMAASVKFLVPFSLFIQAGEWLRPIVAAGGGQCRLAHRHSRPSPSAFRGCLRFHAGSRVQYG